MNQAKVSGIFKQDYSMVAGFNGLVYQIGCCCMKYKQGIEVECTKGNGYDVKGNVTTVWKKTFTVDQCEYYSVQFRDIVMDGQIVDLIEIYGISTDDSVVKILALNSLTGAIIQTSMNTSELWLSPVNDQETTPNDSSDRAAMFRSYYSQNIAKDNSTKETNKPADLDKYHITVETSKVTYMVRVLAEEDSDRIIFEILSGGTAVITRELISPSCDKIVMIMADSKAIILDGFVKDVKQYRYFCNIAGYITYTIPDLFSGSDEEPLASKSIV